MINNSPSGVCNTDSRHLVGSGGVLEGNHTWPCDTGILFDGADDRVVLILLIRSPSFARSSRGGMEFC